MLFQYQNELQLGEAIKSDCLMCSWGEKLIPKYDILRSLVLLVKHYFVTMEGDDNKFKITCQCHNVFVTFKGRSGEKLYITFPHYGLSTLGLYPKELNPESFYFQWTAKKN